MRSALPPLALSFLLPALPVRAELPPLIPRDEYRVDEHFMVLALGPDALPAAGGLVRYGPEFAEFAG